jgi:dephospho-CoA kinase
MRRVALTGGIGSGKSTVSAMLAAHGAVVIDADALAREVVAPRTPGLAAIAAEFGAGLVTPDGELDRPAMGRLVFDDPQARARLEAIIHPLVRSRAAEIESDAASDAVVVQDIPLLVETGQHSLFDTVVVVDTPADVQVERLTGQRGMSAEQARARIAAQASRERRLAVADHVVLNDASLGELTAAVDELWRKLVGGES